MVEQARIAEGEDGSSCEGCLFLNMYDSRSCVIIDCEVRNEKSSGIGHDSVHSVHGNGNGARDSRIDSRIAGRES